jgi:hypothetical protein
VKTVFFDRTCGKKLPQALKLLGLAVEYHAEHFEHNTHDDVWLAAAGVRGWFVITNDKNIRYRESERQALISHGVGCFALGGGSRTRWQQRHPRAGVGSHRRSDGQYARPFIYTIHADGHLQLIYPPPAST